jgi:MoaA/NifB/PqqE/SkfB family radical SAM enzyme
MNLYLTSHCNEQCPFCYADVFLQQTRTPSRSGTERLLGHLRQYAELLDCGEPPPPYRWDLDEETRSLFSARTINLLGGEPTLHPDFQRIVCEISQMGLGVMVFTNASVPQRISAVRDQLWTVVVNGHFAERAVQLDIEPMRIHANLPLQPEMDVTAALEKIRAAGIRTLYLAFATPAGKPGTYYTPDDLEPMQRVHRLAMQFCREHEITVAYDCSFPVCVDPAIRQTKCSSVPVLTPEGEITICGGQYLYEDGKRPLETFRDYREIHRYTFQLISRLRALPSRFDVCNRCEFFNRECHGMCLAFREQPSETTPPLLAIRSSDERV